MAKSKTRPISVMPNTHERLRDFSKALGMSFDSVINLALDSVGKNQVEAMFKKRTDTLFEKAKKSSR